MDRDLTDTILGLSSPTLMTTTEVADGSPDAVLGAVNVALAALRTRFLPDRLVIIGRVTMIDQVLDQILGSESFEPSLTARHPTGFVGRWRAAQMFAYSARDIGRGRLFVLALGPFDVDELLGGIHPMGVAQIFQPGWEEEAADSASAPGPTDVPEASPITNQEG